MSDGLARLMTDLANSLDLQREYIADAEAVMNRYGLSASEKDLMRNGSEDELLTAIGAQKGGQRLFKIVLKPPPTQ